MRRKLAVVGFGHQVQAVELAGGKPLVKKALFRHYRRCHRQSPEVLVLEDEDMEEVTDSHQGDNHDR